SRRTTEVAGLPAQAARAQVRHALAIALVLGAGCKAKPARDDAAAAPRDAAVADAPGDAGDPWPELARFTRVLPVHVVALPAKPSIPRFDVGGPAIAGEIAVVASSQFGFIAVDYHRGQIAWSKPAGLHVAPPLARGGTFVLVGECLSPPDVPDGRTLL